MPKSGFWPYRQIGARYVKSDFRNAISMPTLPSVGIFIQFGEKSPLDFWENFRKKKLMVPPYDFLDFLIRIKNADLHFIRPVGSKLNK